MTTSATSDTELLTEHFGYPPVSLIDDLINSINILAERALNSVEQGLLNAPPSSLGFKPPKATRQRNGNGNGNANGDEGGDAQQQQQQPAELAKAEVEAGTHQLETLLCASIDRNFDKFEIYALRNILCVRPADVRSWMRLSHYEGLDLAAIPDHNTTNGPTLDSINHLRRKLRESMRLNALLTAERARNDAMLEELRALVGAPSDAQIKHEKTSSTSPPQMPKQSPFAFLHDKGSLTDGGSEAPLSTTTAFSLSQMQSLRALSASLSKLAPGLAPPPPPPSHQDSSMDVDNDDDQDKNNDDDAKQNKSWRRERLEYVEGAARRYLEHVEGLELGRHGEVRDGEWHGGGDGGRNPGKEGFEGVERAITVVGGGGGEASSSAAAGPAESREDDGDRMDES